VGRWRIRRRFVESWVSTVLALISIIQGLAFNHLAGRLPEIYADFLVRHDFVVLTHFLLCFVILLRIFQTYLLAALDYDEWSVNFFDLFLVFVIGALEYLLFSSLIAGPRFSAVDFHLRLSLISIAGVLGYLGALLRLRPTVLEYRAEIRLQAINALGTLAVQAISTFIIFSPPQPAALYSSLALAATLLVIANIAYSIRISLPPESRRPFDAEAEGPAAAAAPRTAGRLEVLIRPAEREDVPALLDLMMGGFAEFYMSIFDASPFLTRVLIGKILLAWDGRHPLGYRSFHLACARDDGRAAGLILFESDRRYGLLTLGRLSLQTALRLGLVGLVRSWRNLRATGVHRRAQSNAELHVVYLTAAEPCRGRGVGAQLLDFARTTARAHRQTLLALEVRENNENARRFFAGAGFRAEEVIESRHDARLGQGPRIRMTLAL